jgi:hypothetical protein
MRCDSGMKSCRHTSSAAGSENTVHPVNTEQQGTYHSPSRLARPYFVLVVMENSPPVSCLLFQIGAFIRSMRHESPSRRALRSLGSKRLWILSWRRYSRECLRKNRTEVTGDGLESSFLQTCRLPAISSLHCSINVRAVLRHKEIGRSYLILPFKHFPVSIE